MKTPSARVDWPVAIRPLIRKYKGRKHPLDYQNVYQLVVMVIMSARDSDVHINQVAPKFFARYPDMSALAKARPATLLRDLKGVRSSGHKSQWLLDLAKQVKIDEHIPLNLAGLTALTGIGRKSANVILREAGKPAEGVMVDLHVLRVAPRLGIAKGTNPKKIEEDIMDQLPQKQWEAGMAMSFLGREICRPKPLCEICLMKKVCEYYKKLKHK